MNTLTKLWGIIFVMIAFVTTTKGQSVWSEDFNNSTNGSKFINVNQTKVLPSGGVGNSKCLEVEYDIHSNNGTSRLLRKVSIPGEKEYTLNYDLYFDNDWTRGIGGKFHGFTPDNPTSGCAPIEADGWSCRAVFSNREPHLYTYHQDKNATCGDKSGNGSALNLATWYAVSLHMKVNSADNVDDGFARLYINGDLVAEQTNREFRSVINGKTEITQFYFSTFLGGGPTGSVTQRMHARFDNFDVVKGESIRKAPGGGVVVENQAPTVNVTSPSNGQTFTLGQTITMSANAFDADGSIDKVNFKVNGKYNSQDRNGNPYNSTFEPTSTGTYVIGARAFDNTGAATEKSVTITVVDAAPKDCAGVSGGSATTVCGVCVGGTTGKTAPDADGDGIVDCQDECPNDASNTCNDPTNQAPTLNFTQPVNGDEFDKGVTLVGNVIASDADGSISNVVLYVNGSLVRQENFAPYDWNHKGQDAALQNMAAGTYVLRAVATDNEGLSSEKSITITVKKEVVVTSEAIIGDDCAVKNGVANFEVNSDLRKNATGYSWWFAGSSSSVISPNAAPYTAEITMSQYYKGGEVCVGINSNAAPYYKSYCKSVGVCSAGEELEMAEIEVTEYPNPLEGDQLTIDISEEAGAVEQLVILDEAGSIEFETTSFTSGDKIEIGHLPKGTYIIRIVTENGVVNKKLMKL